jgi:hypothetical protein
MKILLHCCCAACTLGPLRELEQEGYEVTGYFYNPNIHPLIEFRRRLKAQKVLQEHLTLEMVYEQEYGLREYLQKVDWRSEERCPGCCRLRLSRVAREARERGIGAFSTTLLASEHQDHESVRRIGDECARAEGVEFVYRDWRRLARENHERAAQLRLYLQQYCGCVFSEYERFRDTTKHLYRGDRP